MGCEEPHQRERGQEHIQPKNGIVWKLSRGIQPTKSKKIFNQQNKWKISHIVDKSETLAVM